MTLSDGTVFQPAWFERTAPGEPAVVVVSRHHEIREKVIYRGADRGHAVEREPGVVACMDCGHEYRLGTDVKQPPCRPKAEHSNSGYSGIVLDADGRRIGTIHPAIAKGKA